jgi:sec-independent protein translocase protein TatC
VPIITFLTIFFGISTVESLSKKRPYIIVVAFIIGMILTPPDVISQVLLAVPIWLLFEIGLLFAYLVTKNKGKAKSS